MTASLRCIAGLACLLMLGPQSTYGVEQDLALDVEQFDQRLEKLQIYFETGMLEEAATLLEQLKAQFPEEERFKYLSAIVDYQRKSYDRAEGVFLDFIERYPEMPEPYYLLSEINFQKGNQDAARLQLAKYCELVPEDLEAQRRLSLLAADSAGGVILLENGRQDTRLVKKVGFYGGCVHAYQEEAIELINGTSGGWSAMGIDFAHPVDLRGRRIVLRLRGKSGGEKLMLAMRDKFAPDFNPQLIIAPQQDLSDDWQEIKVELGPSASKIDLSQVVHLGLEIGFSTAHNPFNSTLYVRDILIE